MRPESVSLRLTFPGTYPEVRRALGDILTALEPLDLSAEEAGAVELVLAEALNNVVEHAFDAADPGTIELRLHHGERGLLCLIRDNGAAMPRGVPPLGRRVDPKTEPGSAPETGFGWFLIRAVARDLIYRRTGDRNELSFRIAVGLPALTP